MKHKWYTNGKKDLYIKDTDTIPDGFILGRTFGVGKSTFGKHWYNNGIEQGNFKEGEQPNGWVRGTLNKSTNGYKTYNNGIVNKVFSPTDIIPDGWTLGRLKTTNINYIKNAAKHRKIYCNNGETEIKILETSVIPTGYTKGRLTKKALSEKIKERDADYLEKGYISIKSLTTQQKSAYQYYRDHTNEITDIIFKADTYTYINKKYLKLLDEYALTNHSFGTSNKEIEVLTYIKSIYTGDIKTHVKSILKDSNKNYYELDIYIPDKHLAIEFNGTFWHSSLNIDKFYHFNKSIMCEKLGIRLIHIYEYEWDDAITREKIKSLLCIALGHLTTRIYARDCSVRKITNKEAASFNNKNHLQGHRNAQVTYGLFYNGNLMQLMSFSKTKYNKNLKTSNSWEIIRGCPGSNNLIVGGVSKLFKHFILDYNPDSVFSYCDFNKFDGKGYIALGMTFIGYTGPDMKWVLKNSQVVNRQPTKHAELKQQSVAQIFGAGSKKYLWTNDKTVY